MQLDDPNADIKTVGRKVAGAKADPIEQRQVEAAIKTIRARRIATLRGGPGNGTMSAAATAGDGAVTFDPQQTELKSWFVMMQ